MAEFNARRNLVNEANGKGLTHLPQERSGDRHPDRTVRDTDPRLTLAWSYQASDS